MAFTSSKISFRPAKIGPPKRLVDSLQQKNPAKITATQVINIYLTYFFDRSVKCSPIKTLLSSYWIIDS